MPFKLFDIKYENWKSTCEMYFGLSNQIKKSYLQWFPFSQITNYEQNKIISKAFFDRYVCNGAFLLFPNCIYRSMNYMQKSDSTFRDSTLLSPFLYLVLQSLGKEIFDLYKNINNHSVTSFYSGNYNTLNCHYKKEYNSFFKAINEEADNHKYFIKTDITDFFQKINVNKLIDMIDTHCNPNKKRQKISQSNLLVYKEFLLYCGRDHFPLVENSIASSFLATVVYLNDIDKKISDFINKIKIFNDVKIIRYVDDMYVFFNSTQSITQINKFYNRVLDEYSSILKKYDLSLNTNKCCLKECSKVNEELKKAIYDDYMYGIENNIASLFNGKYISFLDELSKIDYVDNKKYNQIINECFKQDDIEFTPNEVYNYFAFDETNETVSKNAINKLILLLNSDNDFIYNDIKRLLTLLLKIEDEKLIKKLLNSLFEKDKKQKKWNIYDETLAVLYLLQRNFKHTDLIKILSQHNKCISSYITNYCTNSFYKTSQDSIYEKYIDIIGTDLESFWFFFMYLIEKGKESTFTEYGYFKTFFDRFSANFAYYQGIDNKPEYDKYYKPAELIKVYKNNSSCSSTINLADDLRNNNPINHSSVQMISGNKKNASKSSYRKIICDLKDLINKEIVLFP